MNLNLLTPKRNTRTAIHRAPGHSGTTLGRASLVIATASVAAVLGACGGGGGGTSSTGTTSTATATPTAALSPDCTGSGCGAVDAGTYSGVGLGVWKYDNTGTKNASLDINIKGVKAGQSITLLYSNGSANTLTNVPTPTTPDLTQPNPVPSRVDMVSGNGSSTIAHVEEDSMHAQMLERNREAANEVLTMPKARFSMEFLAQSTPQPHSAPAIGSSGTWIEGSATPAVTYKTNVADSCQLPSGRNVVFWLDPNADSRNPIPYPTINAVTPTDITAMKNTVCGANGGFDRLKNLLGDVWGSDATKYSNLIQDPSGGLKDINIAILAVDSPNYQVDWAGYFWGQNNILRSYEYPKYVNSNESLVFFINASQVHSDRNYALSTLLHEATHMTNFYQRSVSRDVDHDTWLEETSAMMTEDIVSPTVISGYNKIDAYRLPSYLSTGGGVSYINWSATNARGNYGVGGSFGAYLNRRFGIGLYQQLLTSCSNEATQGSYQCLDSLIKLNGGVSFADEFAHFGASAFGAISATNSGVAKYGFPAKVSNGYSLQAIDVASKVAGIPHTATSLTSTFPATSHTYLRETVNSSTYTRKGVTVPAQSTLIVVVQ